MSNPFFSSHICFVERGQKSVLREPYCTIFRLIIYNESDTPTGVPWGKGFMPSGVFQEEDVQEMRARGIDAAEVSRQIEIFRRGAEPVRLIRPARVGDGIVQINPEERHAFLTLHGQAAGQGRMLKFVPASGAASRMFKDWQNLCQRGTFASKDPSVTFLRNLARFAFYDDLKRIMTLGGQDIERCIREERCADILNYVLTPKGLNYAWLPKALLKFHSYPGHTRTAMEEHLAEAAFYVRDANKTCRIHFTVSQEHESLFRELLSRVKKRYEDLFDVHYDVSFSVQHPSTDTLAVDMENRPCRDRTGKIMFRPGGHGALLHNLNAIGGDIVFLKNIDNVVPDTLKETTVLHKKILGGYLLWLQDEIFRSLNLLSGKNVDEEQLSHVLRFCEESLFISVPHGFRNLPMSARKEFLSQRLNRPLRVCGMVKNEGEPGGGPFWVHGEDGTPSLQIVEQHETDPHSKEQKDIWKSSTHFNPVDLVCGIRDFRGEQFDLNRYANRNAVALSVKSHEGADIKTLELPGLWNGSMAYWNTVFVDVPIETFNPVKTVDDLLRKSHLPTHQRD
jgi:hypothetical protein